jgi:hypothetical protein
LNIGLKHAHMVNATCETSLMYFYNIQMKHLKHKSEGCLVGTSLPSKLGLGGRREQRSSVHPRCNTQISPSYRQARWMGVQAQVSPASPSATGKVNEGMARGAEQRGMCPGAAAERKACGRCGRALSLSAVTDSRRCDDIF